MLAPTRELALQVAEAMQDYGRHLRIHVLAVYGGQAFGQQIMRLRRGADIVVGTPGRLLDLLERKILDLSAIRTVVLDEADEMLKMGFIDDVEAILAKLRRRDRPRFFPPPYRRRSAVWPKGICARRSR